MARSKRRDRSIIFRVDEQEYKCLKSACEAAGNRSLSDYTRTELLLGAKIDASDPCLLERLLEIDRKLSELCRLAVQVLESMHVNGSAAPDDKFGSGLGAARIAAAAKIE